MGGVEPQVTRRYRWLAGAVLALPVFLGVLLHASAAFAAFDVASVTTGGVVGNMASTYAAISSDGRYVAFLSRASNLVPGDTGGWQDVFVRDRLNGITERVSVSTAGVAGGNDCIDVDMSADGRYVVFSSWASNLVVGDTNGVCDVFVHDRLLHTTCRVNLGSGGVQGNAGAANPAISADGRYVVFHSWATNLDPADTNGAVYDIFIRDRTLGLTALVSKSAGGAGVAGNDESYNPDISANGQYVVFESDATNLVADDTNGVRDVFRRSITGTMVRVSLTDAEAQSNSGSQYPSISSDGRYVAFRSNATNLVTGDTNGVADIFRRDLSSSATVRVSVSDAEAQSNGQSSYPAISEFGYYVAFETDATNLFTSDTNGHSDIILRAVGSGTTVCVSRNADGTLLDGTSTMPVIDAGGKIIAYATSASNTTAADTNGVSDVCVYTYGWHYAPVEHDAGGVTFNRWVTGYSTAYSGGGYAYSPWAGTALEFQFQGAGVEWFGPMQPNYGKAEVWLDGVYKATVDCYAPPESATLRTPIWWSDTLTNSVHTLQIRPLGTKDPASTGTIVVVDYFNVNSLGLGATKARYDEKSAGVTWTGTWVKPRNSTYYGSVYAYSHWPPATCRMRFYGTRVAWIGPKTAAYGYARVYIDGLYYATVDQYGPTGWRNVVWESPLVTRGWHTLEIRPTGTKRAAATAANVVVDAFDVTP